MILRPNFVAESGDRDEELLARRASELAERAKYSIVLSDFLSPREQLLFAANSDGRNAGFWGGAFGCDRRIAVLIPEWLENDVFSPVFSRESEEFAHSLILSSDDDEIKNFVIPLEIRGSGYVKLTHRDYLGALLALGIKRNLIGDIETTNDSCATVFVQTRCAEFISANLTSVGRDTVRINNADIDDDHEISKSFSQILGTVASPRLDCVVAELIRSSRAEAANVISAADVEVNYRAVTRVDHTVNSGDIISVRGKGKFVITAFGDLNRRGRIRFDAKKYV